LQREGESRRKVLRGMVGNSSCTDLYVDRQPVEKYIPKGLGVLDIVCPYPYNFAFNFSFSLNLRFLRRIFPLGFFGIDSTNSIPPFNHLYRTLCFSTNFSMFLASFLLSLTPGLRTMKALGTSPEYSSGIPITAASSMRS
jgi:hypothetical protein